jgi:dihydroxyacetone kinase phosphotransfer subunit
MVNLVFVSHSRQLAEGVRELATQMCNEDVSMVAAGGLLCDDGTWALGTDAVRIADAIHDHWSGDGVLILADLGSAVLSAEQAIELLPVEIGRQCLISNAPLVEGAVVAALEAGLGRSLEEVNCAAEAAAHMSKV